MCDYSIVTCHVIDGVHFHYFVVKIWLSRTIYTIPLIDRSRQDDYNGGLIEIVVKIKISDDI